MFLSQNTVGMSQNTGYTACMSIFVAVVLGFVQGLTEFLPVSSTGHLILARAVFGIENIHGLAFDAVLQLASVGAVLVYFFPDVWMLTQTALRKLGRLPVNKKDEVLLYALLIGTIPALVGGLLLESLMQTAFRSPVLVAIVLLLGSVFFMFAEYMYHNKPRTHEMNITTGLKIGLFQVLALVPGMSRSGATICGGMLLGLTRSEAARFAFLLSIPIILGGGLKKLLELIVSHEAIEWTPLLIGTAVSFVTSLIAIRFLLSYVRSHTLWPFIWYRIILASFVLFVVFFG